MPGGKMIVRVSGLSKEYAQHRSFSRDTHRVHALCDVHLEIAASSTLAIVGESGSGKSTLARCLALIEVPTTGAIWFEERNLCTLTEREKFPYRGQIQMVFQDPSAALNPRFTAIEIIVEPLKIHGRGGTEEQRERARALMEQVGLSARWAGRRPREFSGGQRQRLAIARALALEPRLLILDEALSALDPPLQAQIINLLLKLRAARGLSYVFITHDLATAAYLADEVAILKEGRIVERTGTTELFSNPKNAYTQALLAAAPTLEAIHG
ncbi:MAG: ABC transporter ATP-binding protein [Candidatus Acidiferrales bacterium]